MTISNEKPFLTRIKSALNGSSNTNRDYSTLFPDQPKEKVRDLLNRIAERSREEQQRLLDQLIEAGKPINLNVFPVESISATAKAIAALVKKKEPEWGRDKHVVIWKHPLITRLDLSNALAPQDIVVHETTLTDTETGAEGRLRIREEIISSFIGITTADYCVADSATLVMKNRPDQARAASLVPSIHIAIVQLEQIIANLKELYALLKDDPQYSQQGITNCLTFISGPSKTADIEAVMVHGAHGPRELFLFVITGDTP